MRHRKTPGWVMELRRQRGAPLAAAPRLSDLIGSIEVVCDPCGRRGCYRADRLLADFGDLMLPEVLAEIARRGKCHRALNPPDVTAGDTLMHRCMIRGVDPRG
ncbi:hypothetical protein [Devosia sp.]|uniref:hypothetical protein n=1 Tax=Devosia sp. TaxID=1871048 RepID=UPI001AC0FCDE|nr:hypothetical protein [Devosia sp.]MBN9309000.1 hypothetical protein [Devosia sp.]